MQEQQERRRAEEGQEQDSSLCPNSEIGEKKRIKPKPLIVANELEEN